MYDHAKTGYLGKAEVKLVVVNLIDRQIQDAEAEAHGVKLDMAKQQASLERFARVQRQELKESAEKCTKEQVEQAMALHMGSRTGPVMAGMMSGYVDIPAKCLMGLKSDEELINAWVDFLFRNRSTWFKEADQVSMQDFEYQYLNFFESAPRVLREEGQPENYDCAVQ